MDILEHPLDRHALYQRELSEHCNVLSCTVCSSRIHGSTSIYCCKRCGFYLHPSCAAKIPHQIQHHPLHPDHPLTLGTGDINRYRGTRKVFLKTDGSYRYAPHFCCPACERRHTGWGFYCSSCPFDLHVGCALVGLLPDGEPGQEQATFGHFAHPCPLALLNAKDEHNIKCEACDLQLSGEVYGCRRCSFFLHETCAASPQEIRRHPFHSHHPLTLVFCQKDQYGRPQLHCHACRCWVLAAYHCKDCRFNLCQDCSNAALPLGCLREETEDSRPPTDHFFHQHPLAFYCTEKEMRVRCKACDQHVSGEFYGCPDCSFFVHEPCVESLSREIHHYLHPDPDHPLILSPPPLNPSEESKRCRCCDDSLGKDFSYNCKACNFSLHVPCALQTPAYLEQEASEKIIHLIDEYEFTLLFALGNICHLCDSCAEHCQGPAYRCKSIWLHKACAEALLNIDPFHHQHRLALVYERDHDNCNCCGETILGRICYRCEECGNFKLHTSCVQTPTLRHPLHAHGLTYYQRKCNSNLRCRVCGKPCAADLYSCELCNVYIHYDCLQIPQTVKSNHHIDDLTLYESIVEDDSGEYYCDICEERRDPELWAYYCEVCKLIAHVACAVSPVKLNVVGEYSELLKLEEKIEGRQQEVDKMRANWEKLTVELEETTTELEALKAKRAAAAYE